MTSELPFAPDGVPVATFRFGLEGEPPAGWTPDDDELLRWSTPTLDARLRVFADVDAWSVFLTLDSRVEEDQPLPLAGVAVTAAPGWTGWSWTSDTDGLLTLAPTDAEGPVWVIRLTQGALRAVPSLPVFTDEPRPQALFGSTPLAPGTGAFHLTPPGGVLGAHRRFQTTLRVERVASLAAVGPLLPAWLPDLVAPAGDLVELVGADRAVVSSRTRPVATDGERSRVGGSAGHGDVLVHGVKGVQRLRVSFVPGAQSLLVGLVEVLKARRPSVVPTASAVVVSEALVRSAAVEPDAVVDWLEREDWLARGDLLGVVVAANLAATTHDCALVADAARALSGRVVGPGYGLVAMKVWLANLAVAGGVLDTAALLTPPTAVDELTRLELALVGYRSEETCDPLLAGVVNRLGGRLPGQPLGLPASEAGRLVSLLRLCPEGWERRAEASATAEKAAGLLLCDYADGLHTDLDGLAWLLLGELGI